METETAMQGKIFRTKTKIRVQKLKPNRNLERNVENGSETIDKNEDEKQLHD